MLKSKWHVLALIIIFQAFVLNSSCFGPVVNDGALQLRNIIGRMNVLFNSNKDRTSRSCLLNKRSETDGKVTVKASFIFAVEGNDLRLSCDCLSEGNLRWVRLDLNGDITQVNPRKSSEYWIDSNALVFKNVVPGIATYFCESIGSNELIGGIWTVEVVATDMFETKTRKDWLKPTKSIISGEFQLGNSNMIVRLLRKPYSQCSYCNVVGKRHRVGYCSVEIDVPSTSIAPLTFYDSPISCSLFLELDPDFLSKLHVDNQVLTDLRHALGQKHQLEIGYCKVNCSAYKQPALGKQVLELYRQTLMNGDNRDGGENDEDTVPAKSIIWILKSLVNGIPFGRKYVPEIFAFLSLIALQVWICSTILRGYKSGQAQ